MGKNRREFVGRKGKKGLSRDSMLDLFRRGEVLPEGRTNEEEMRLIEKEEVRGQRAEVRPEKMPEKVLTAESAKSAEKKT